MKSQPERKVQAIWPVYCNAGVLACAVISGTSGRGGSKISGQTVRMPHRGYPHPQMKNLDALTTFIVLPSQTRSGLFCSRGRATSSRKGEGEASILRLNPLLSSFSLDSFRGLAGGVACMIPACRMRLTENGSMAVKAQGGYWLTMCGRFQPLPPRVAASRGPGRSSGRDVQGPRRR